MNRPLPIFIALTLAITTTLTACNRPSSEPLENNPADPAEEVLEPQAEVEIPDVSDSTIEQQAYQQQLTAELQKIDEKIARLESEVPTDTNQAQTELNQQVIELGKKLQARAQLNRELDSEIAALLEKLSATSESEPNSQLSGLRQKREILQAALQEMQTTDSANWQELKTKLETELAIPTPEIDASMNE